MEKLPFKLIILWKKNWSTVAKAGMAPSVSFVLGHKTTEVIFCKCKNCALIHVDSNCYSLLLEDLLLMWKVLACYSQNIQWVIVAVQEQARGSMSSQPGKNRRKTFLPLWWADCPLCFSQLQLAIVLDSSVSWNCCILITLWFKYIPGCVRGTADGILGCLSGVWLLLVLLTNCGYLCCNSSVQCFSEQCRCHCRSLCLLSFCSLWYKDSWLYLSKIRKAVWTKELTFFSFRAADEHLVEQHDSALYSTAVPYLLRTALPLSSCSLLLAWASNAFASSCSMPAFLLASADSSVFLVMRSSTVLYLLFSSVSRTCCSTHKHKMEPLKRQCRGSCPISGLRREESAQVTKTATGSRDFLFKYARFEESVRRLISVSCTSVAVLQLQH